MQIDTLPKRIFPNRLPTGEYELFCYARIQPEERQTQAVERIAWRITAEAGNTRLSGARSLTEHERASGRVAIAAILPTVWAGGQLTIEAHGSRDTWKSRHEIGCFSQSGSFRLPLTGTVLVVSGHRIGEPHRFEPDYLLIDTNTVIRETFPRDDGFIEFGYRLPSSPHPLRNIKAVYFLINSGNSLEIYRLSKVGEVKLIFKDAPPIVTQLLLGKNIREWCIGNQFDLVREVSDRAANGVAWKGENTAGINAVMDCLEIPVFECMRGQTLEQIIFAYNSTKKSLDTTGVHFSVFSITLEIA